MLNQLPTDNLKRKEVWAKMWAKDKEYSDNAIDAEYTQFTKANSTSCCY